MDSISILVFVAMAACFAAGFALLATLFRQQRKFRRQLEELQKSTSDADEDE